MSNFIKIGLFSKIAQVTIRALRHYDELGLLKPAWIEPSTNYRYYTYDQLIRLNQILVLKDAGFSLEQVASMIDKAMTIEDMQRMMQQKKDHLAQQISEAAQQIKSIEVRLNQLKQLGEQPKYEIVIKRVPGLRMAALRRIVPKPQDMPGYRCRMFGELDEWLSRTKCTAEQEYVFYHMSEFIEENFDIEVAYSISREEQLMPDGNTTIFELPPEPMVASLVYQGPFMGVGDALLELFTWLGVNGYSPTGPVRELHLFGRENNHHDFNQVLVELQVPISP
ncbi:MerR family transcriptional regulator [Paenibacillus hexagrammi]|uniref:MerR family transcriptional regulator n=1 Tax=Paenibacillus hexagrammi TaxID=2908839 RepID=A0ABY3SKM5_9BACL|nr:MerR family transcriptional regulator [Paenibacillus sp. YPD9-1]UJF33537.1 MerR family transcriptional regulator [Paenibacillus sp. YPD9-1]